MTRLIDADALKLDIACVYGSNPKYLNWLNNAPTVDAVPVIRCRVCLKKRICSLYREANQENGFCAWGAKEEE